MAGREWPLFEIVTRLAPSSGAARRAVKPLTEIRAESLTARRRRHTLLFAGPGRPRFWLYESAFLSGRMLSPETFAVERLYRAAGLETVGAELPDHASMELAFLAHLAKLPEDSAPAPRSGVLRKSPGSLERRFLEKHAGRWLPALGHALARSGDEVYAPIGKLLADWLEEAIRPRAVVRGARLPVIQRAEACGLCGFCVQICPTRALAVRETSTATTLVLNAAACVGCARCERICEMHALTMNYLPENSELLTGWRVLRQSPRALCPACGLPTISQAELHFVETRIGHPAWLDYCLECRRNPAPAEIAR